jgi:hypothetical protein
MATKTKAALRECFVTHALHDPDTDGHVLVVAGTKWREDSGPVTTNPSFFHPVDIAEDERPNWRQFIRPGHQQHRPEPVPSGARQRPRGLHTGA